MRAEFSDQTKLLVAARAGYRCSFPECGKLTVGPARDPEKADTTGVAAHIYGAALSGLGPRGSRELTPQELRSQQNAIWLCEHHASLVDKRQGEDFSPETLHSYKALHETRIAHEHAGIHSPFGWVDKVTVNSSPLSSSPFTLRLAKLNLVVGKNSTGKTALCEWIAGFSSPACLERWSVLHPDSLPMLSARVDYFDPEPHFVGVELRTRDYPRYKMDGKQAPVSTRSVNVVFPQSIERPVQHAEDHLQLMAKALKLHPYGVRATCDALAGRDGQFYGATFETDDEGTWMHVRMHSKAEQTTRHLRLLSSSERERLMMELGMTVADNLSTVGPTLFILDVDSWTINGDWLHRYGRLLGASECRFQTIITTRPGWVDFNDLPWTGWKVFRLEGSRPNVTLSPQLGE